MLSLKRPGGLWVVWTLGVLSISCRGDKPEPPSIDAGVGPVRRAQMLTTSTDARGLARLGSSASDFADFFLIDAETQKPIADAVIEGLPDEAGQSNDDGYLVRVSKASGGYRPELVRVRKGGQRTVPLAASTPDLPGRAVRLSQKVYNEDFLGEADLAGVNQFAASEGRPEIVFSPVLDGSNMMSARFNVYRSALPATLLALKVEGDRPAEGSVVRSRARVVSTSGPRRAGARVLPTQIAAAGEKRDDDSYVAPVVNSLTVGTPDGSGQAMVSWNVDDPSRVLAFEVGVDTTRPAQRVAPSARSLPIAVRKGTHFVCVRPVFPGSDLESEVRCQPFDAPNAPPAANVRVRVRPPADGSAAPRRRQPTPVDVEVENLGDTDAPPFTVDVVLSRDGRSEGGLGEVRTLRVDGVKAKTMAVRRTEITPPRDGALYVVARADSGKQLVETNAEDNNDRLPVEIMPMGDNHSPVLSVAGTNVGGGGGGRLIRGQPLRLRANADDQEDGDLSSAIAWYSSRDGKLTDGAALETSNLTPGIHRVRAQVSDRGRPAAQRPQPSFWRRLFLDEVAPREIQADEPPETVTAEFTIEVVEPEMARAAQSPPAISAGPDLTTTVGGEVTPLATAEDADGDTLTFAWTAQDEAGAAAEVLDASKLRPRFRPATAGRYRLTLTVGDGQTQERDEMEVLALAADANDPPEVSVVLPASGVTGSPVYAEVIAFDPDGDGVTVSYALSERPAGSTVLIGDVNAQSFSTSFVPDLPGQYRLTVTADDGRGRTSQASAGTWVVQATGTPDGGTPDAPEPDGAAGPDGGPVVPQPIGANCGGPAGCQSGHCVEGICCDSPCLGLCSSCRRPNQVGTCGLVAEGQDPRDDCPSTSSCNGSGACSAFAVRPGGELIASGANVELAGTPYSTGEPEDSDRMPVACDPGSGLCAFFKLTTGDGGVGQADLLVVDGRSAAMMQPRLVSAGVSTYASPGHGGRAGFVRGTLLYVTTSGEVWAWRAGWASSHRLAGVGSSCVVSRNGKYAACYANRQINQDSSESFDLVVGELVQGGAPLPRLRAMVWNSSDRYGELPVFSPDELWLASRGRSDLAATTAIVLDQMPPGTGSPVTVVAEDGLDDQMYFSPNSQWLAFMRAVSIPQSEGNRSGTLAIADVSGAPTVRNLMPGTSGFGWYKAPDGSNQLAFMNEVVNQQGTLQKFVDVTTASPQPTRMVDGVSSETLVFAPSVGRMAILRDTNNDQVLELWTMELGGGNLIKLSDAIDFSSSTPPLFAPAGDRLAWSATMADLQSLFISPLIAGGMPKPVGGRPLRMEFTASGGLLFTEGDAYRGETRGATSIPGYYGPLATLRLFDNMSYPSRVLQPGVRDYFALAGDYALFVVSGQGWSDGLYRISLGPPPAPSSCDPIAQNSCPSGSGCFLRGPGDVTSCGPAGSGGLQATCSADANCAPGYQCLQGACLKICSLPNPACPGETPYCQPGPGNAYLGVCLTAPPAGACDPVRRTGCASGDACRVEPDGQNVCSPSGGGGQGQFCEVASECQPGYGCLNDYDGAQCRQYCDTRSPACPSENPACRGLPGTWVGYCAAATEPVCDPVQQTGCATGDACYLYDFSGATSCTLPGGSGPGAYCSVANECGRGLGCFEGPDGRRCRPHCYVETPTCPGEAPYCVPVGQGYGYCAPGGPPPPPDGGAPPPPDAGTMTL
jgi:hypothetical protein